MRSARTGGSLNTAGLGDGMRELAESSHTYKIRRRADLLEGGEGEKTERYFSRLRD